MPAFATIIGAPCPPDRIDCNAELKARSQKPIARWAGEFFLVGLRDGRRPALDGLLAGSFVSS